MLQLLDFSGGLKVEIGEYTGRNGKYLHNINRWGLGFKDFADMNSAVLAKQA